MEAEHQVETQQTISDRTLTWILGISLLLGGLTNFSPFLHLVVRHGSLDLSQAHIHTHQKGLRPIAARQSDKKEVSKEDFRRTQSRSERPHTGKEPASKTDGDLPSDHEHHGLPELLLWGMLDAPAPEQPVVFQTSLAPREHLQQDFDKKSSTIDPATAPRPPPFVSASL